RERNSRDVPGESKPGILGKLCMPFADGCRCRAGWSARRLFYCLSWPIAGSWARRQGGDPPATALTDTAGVMQSFPKMTGFDSKAPRTPMHKLVLIRHGES